MATKTNLSSTITGKFVFVSGINGGREVFFGRCIDEPYGEHVTVEGKFLSFTPQGVMVVRPFTTLCTFPAASPNIQIQQITNPEALTEITNLFNMSVTTVSRTSYPLTFRWVEGAIFNNFTAGTLGSMGSFAGGVGLTNVNRLAVGMANIGLANLAANNPFSSFYQGFLASAEQFRRALFQSPQVSSTRELDKLTELEGDLTIEIGKVTNQVAVKFNQVIGRNNDLTHYFESIYGFTLPMATTNTLGGWVFLMNRLQIAKNWTRRNGKTQLVREINGLIKDGIHNLNEVILEHCTSLDTLITETFSQYGINFEIYGDITPFANYTVAPAFGGSLGESYETNPSMSYAGSGV